jgi:hypothetical protein
MKMTNDTLDKGPLNLVAAWGMLVLSVLGLVALLFSSAVPSPAMVTIAKWAAIVVALFYAVFFWGVPGFGWNEKANASLEGKKGASWLRNRFFRAPFMALVFFFFAWMGLGSGAPWLLNFVIGHDGEMVATIDGWDTGSRKSCSHPTVQHVPPLMSAPHSLCLDKTQQQNLPPGKSVKLLGQVSFLGVTADRIEW